MTVKQLIAQLKKMPQNADVYWQDHDHQEHEVNGHVQHVSIITREEATNSANSTCTGAERKQMLEFINERSDPYVVLR